METNLKISQVKPHIIQKIWIYEHYWLGYSSQYYNIGQNNNGLNKIKVYFFIM